jgi:peptidoglycan/LPS O-acetylase OafA/YrhL
MAHAGAGPRPDFFNPHVHGARGLFAFGVFLYHVVNSGFATFPALETGPARFALGTLEYGVELFFCISGFVILGALRRAPGAGAFLRDRAIRIYPVLWASVLAMGGLGALAGAREFGRLPPGEVLALLPANLLALPGILPIWAYHPAAWSLSYEMAFYALCALAWWLRPRLGPARAAALWGPAAAVMLVLYPRAVFFVAGVLVAEGVVARRLPGVLRWFVRHPLPPLLVFLAAWGGVAALGGGRGLGEATLLDWVGDARLPLALLAFAAATLAFQGIVDGRGLLGALLVTRPLLWLGTISYSFYLWHLPVMGAARRLMGLLGLADAAGPWAQAVFLALSLPPALLVAAVSRRLLESWLGDRLRGRRRAPRGRGAVPGGTPAAFGKVPP